MPVDDPCAVAQEDAAARVDIDGSLERAAADEEDPRLGDVLLKALQNRDNTTSWRGAAAASLGSP
jgi:hypothetical protein